MRVWITRKVNKQRYRVNLFLDTCMIRIYYMDKFKTWRSGDPGNWESLHYLKTERLLYFLLLRLRKVYSVIRFHKDWWLAKLQLPLPSAPMNDTTIFIGIAISNFAHWTKIYGQILQNVEQIWVFHDRRFCQIIWQIFTQGKPKKN